MSGMHSDNYEFARSNAPQSIKDYSAFTDKQWNSKVDSNGGVYQAQNSMVEIDISSIYQSDGYTDVSDFYVVIPLTMVAVCHNSGTVTAAPTAGYSLCTLKNNYQNLIHSMELVLMEKQFMIIKAFKMSILILNYFLQCLHLILRVITQILEWLLNLITTSQSDSVQVLLLVVSRI
jgi:hypothetical protein